MSFARQIRFYIYVLIAVIVAFSVFVGGFYLWHQLERDRVLESLRYHRLNTQLLDEIQVELLQFKLELGKRDTASGGAGEPTVVSAKSVIRKRKYNGMLHLISSRMEQLLTSQRPHTEAMTAPAMARVKNRFAEFKSIITRLVYGEGSLSQVDTTQVDIFYTSLEQLKRLHNILYQDDADEHSESDRRDVPILALIILATLCMGAFAVFRLIRQIDHVIARNKRAEEDLRASQLLLRTIFDAIPIPVFVKDAERRFVMVNTAASNKYGLDPVEALGRRADEFPQFFEAGVQAVAMEEKEVMRTGIAMEIPERVSVREDGTEEWHRAIRVPLFDNEGNVTGLVAIREDITERRRTVIALEESRQFLRAVFDTIPSPITVRDRDGNLTMVNKAHVAGTGLTPEQFIALPDRYPLLIQEDAQKVEAANKKVMETGELISEEAPYRWKAGGENYYQTERVPLKNIQGETIGVIVVHQDITERKRAEDNLRQNEAQLQQVFDSIPHTVILKDREGRYLQVNQAACEFWGVTPEQILGSKAADLPGRSEEEFAAIVSSDKVVLDGGEGIRWFQQKLTDSSGNPRSFQTAKTAMKDSEGNVTGLVSVGLDITERVRAEEDLRDSRRLLQTVFDALPIGLVVKDTSHRFIMVNQASASRHGRDPSEYYGRTLQELSFMTEESIRNTHDDDQWVIKHGKILERPEQLEHYTDKEDQWHHVIRAPLLDEAGQVTGLVVVREDITDRIRAEEDLLDSRRLLQTVFDALPVQVFVKDAENKYLMVNRKVLDYSGLTNEDFQGRHVLETPYGTSEQRELFLESDRQVMETGEPFDMANRPYTSKDGDHRIQHVVKVPIKDEEGNVLGVVGVSEDITERVRAEEDLRASQRLLQTVFDTIPVGVFVKNKEGVTIMVNKSHAASMNHRPDFFENKTIQELGIASPDDLARMTEMDQVVLKEGEIVDLPEDQLTMPNGEVKWWHLVKTPLRDDKGDIIGLVGMREDITERKQIDVMKQEFISVVSHELRTPLTSIIGSVGLILGGVGGKIPKKANRLLQIANSNSQRLLRIINDMLYLEKMESGKMDLEMMPVKVCKLVEDAVRENMPYADNYNVQFELRQATGESTVWGNEESLMQVLANLLSNAAKFSTPGGVVVLSADVLESGVQISVSDQGAGVPLEAQESIFDKFFQVDSSDSRSREGTGLGLSISREIVRNHGSELKLESTPGEGSRFYFELPFSSAGGNQEGAATADSQSEAG